MQAQSKTTEAEAEDSRRTTQEAGSADVRKCHSIWNQGCRFHRCAYRWCACAAICAATATSNPNPKTCRQHSTQLTCTSTPSPLHLASAIRLMTSSPRVSLHARQHRFYNKNNPAAKHSTPQPSNREGVLDRVRASTALPSACTSALSFSRPPSPLSRRVQTLSSAQCSQCSQCSSPLKSCVLIRLFSVLLMMDSKKSSSSSILLGAHTGPPSMLWAATMSAFCTKR